MRVKIISIKHPSVWYRNSIGEEVEVKDIKKGLYEVVGSPQYKLFKDDCESVESVDTPKEGE